MNRFVMLAFVLAFLPFAASAQKESVEVDGKETLSGLWKISFPAGATMYMPGRGLNQTGEKVSAVCLPGWGPDSGAGDLDGKHLHLAWGIALARTVVDTKIETASAVTFNGAFAFKVIGIRHDAPTPASARKLVLDQAAPDKADMTKLLNRTLEELAAGTIISPHEANLALNFGQGMTGYKPNTPEEIRSLGKVEVVVYLGEGRTVRPRFTDADATHAVSFPIFSFSAYQVVFANGERLCGIHRRDDGVLDGFVCV